MPGVVKVVRDGNFLAVVAVKEFLAVKAMNALRRPRNGRRRQACRSRTIWPTVLTGLPSQDSTIFERSDPSGRRRQDDRSNLHTALSVAWIDRAVLRGRAILGRSDDGMDPYARRLSRSCRHRADAEDAACERSLIHVEGSGCYGHNGADDAAADAALIARAMPGVPIRVQWMREQEHAWEPYGPAMVTKLKASLDEAGKIADWNFEVWSNTHSMRPGGAGCMLAAQHMAQPFAVPAPKPLAVAGRRRRPQRDPDLHLPQCPCGASLHPGDAASDFGDARARRLSQRVFDREFHGRAGAGSRMQIPSNSGSRHLDDQRGRDVIEKAAQRVLAGRRARKPPPDRGFGFAFARYKNLAAYCAIASEVEVNRETGRPRLVARWRRSTADRWSIRTG